MLDNSGVKTSRLWDKVAVVLSGLCLVHCLALPVLVAVVPFLSELSAGHLHAELLVIVIPISVLAFAIGFHRHRNWTIVGAGVLGMAVLTIGGTYVHDRYGLAADRALTITGSVILAIAHFYNSRHSRHQAKD